MGRIMLALMFRNESEVAVKSQVSLFSPLFEGFENSVNDLLW